MNEEIPYDEEKPGNLAFMVSWTSKDGRPTIIYYDTYEKAKEHLAWLGELGNNAKIFRGIQR